MNNLKTRKTISFEDTSAIEIVKELTETLNIASTEVRFQIGELMSIKKFHSGCYERRLNLLLKKHNDDDYLKVRLTPNDELDITLVKIIVEFKGWDDEEDTKILDLLGSSRQLLKLDYAVYLKFSNYQEMHGEALKAILQNTLEQHDFSIKRLDIVSSIIVDIGSSSNDISLSDNVFKYDESKNGYTNGYLTLSLPGPSDENTLLPDVLLNCVEKKIQNSATNAFYEYLKLAIISVHSAGLRLGDEPSLMLKPLNTVFVTTSKNPSSSVFDAILKHLNAHQHHISRVDLKDLKYAEFDRAFNKIKCNAIIDDLRAHHKESRKDNKEIDQSKIEALRGEYIGESLPEYKEYENRLHINSLTIQNILEHALASRTGCTLVNQNIDTLFKQLKKEDYRASEISALLRGEPSLLADIDSNGNNLRTSAYLSIFGALNHHHFAQFALATASHVGTFGVEDIDFIIDFDAFKNTQDKFDVDIFKKCPKEIEEIVECVKKCRLLKQRNIAIDISAIREFDCESEQPYLSRLASIAVAMEIGSISYEEIRTVKSDLRVNAIIFERAKSLLEHSLHQHKKILDRTSVMMSSSAIILVEKIALENLTEFSTRDICQREWGGVGRKSHFVNELLGLLKKIGFVQAISSERNDTSNWVWNAWYSYDLALKILKGKKY